MDLEDCFDVEEEVKMAFVRYVQEVLFIFASHDMKMSKTFLRVFFSSVFFG